MAIIADLKDPRIQGVTVTQVEVTPDMRQAKVHVSIMGDDTRQQLSLRGLQNAAGFLQARISDRIETRYTPRLEFVLDLGVKKSIEVAQLLHQVLPPKANADGLEVDDEDQEHQAEDATTLDDESFDGHASRLGSEGERG